MDTLRDKTRATVGTLAARELRGAAYVAILASDGYTQKDARHETLLAKAFCRLYVDPKVLSTGRDKNEQHQTN